ncbi:hypothetical protein RRG08_028138 [Elysia crispata]|uniref:Major facilitator superfamily (MFS) profile domain-containing protein n=1 Tax=Elysia crispata TaxID=231223 RepID=A0AAE1D7F3_9GAST|nr:hypothetical protein RRG08_028138 [Elysia crispata]
MTQGGPPQSLNSTEDNIVSPGFNKEDYEEVTCTEYSLPHNGNIDRHTSEQPQKQGKLLSGKTPGLQQISPTAAELKSNRDFSNSLDPEQHPDGRMDAMERVEGPKIDLRVKLYLGIYFFVVLISTCKMALPAPFFPHEAAKKGTSSTLVGLIFSVFEFVVTVASPVFGRYMVHFGPNWLFLAGLFLSGSATVVFGLLHMCPAGSAFVALSIVVRAMEALGFAATSTSFVTTLCYFFPNNYASVYAFGCSLCSLGSMLGPPIGAVFYEIGGFGLPFYIMGGVTLILEPVLIPLLPDIKASETDHKTADNSSSKSVLLLARSGLVWAGMLGLFMSAVGNSFLQPVLATHLETYGLKALMIGICFSIHPILYTLFTPVLGFLTDKLNIKEPLLLMSSVGCCVAYSLIGPTPVLSFLPRQLWIVLLGYMILGISEAGLTIPTAKCLASGAMELDFPSDVSTHGLMSGLNLCGYHFGAFVGPLLAGSLTDAMGFGRSTFLVSCLYLVTFAIFCSILVYRHKNSQRDHRKPEETAPLINQKHNSCVPCHHTGKQDMAAPRALSDYASLPGCDATAALLCD